MKAKMTQKEIQEIYDARMSIKLWAGDAYYAVRINNLKLAAECQKKSDKLAREILLKYDIIVP